jgi:acyl-CoA thioester hydrolase
MERLVPAPLRLHATTVRAEWVDYNDHLSEWAYLLIFGDNADAFFRYIGVDEAYRANGYSLYTAETYLRHVREVKLGQQLRLTLRVLGHDAKRVHVLHEMFAPGVGCAATAEQMLLHVCTRSARVEPFGPELRSRLSEIAVIHDRLLVPDFVGRPIRTLPAAGGRPAGAAAAPREPSGASRCLL